MSGHETPQWALERAGALSDFGNAINTGSCWWWTWEPVKAFARYISEHETEPVDPLLIEAREVAAGELIAGVRFVSFQVGDADVCAANLREGRADDSELIKVVLSALRRGIELGKQP